MRIGNTLATVRPGLLAMTIVGSLADAVVFCVCAIKSIALPDWPVFIALVFIPPVAFFLACLPTLAVSITFKEGRVKHLLFDRFVMSDLPASDFLRVRRQKSALPIIIEFKHGRKIRFLGAHLGMISTLETTLARERSESDS